MKITRENLKNIVREAMVEESAYQEFFKKALEKTGKSIPQMSDEEKKAFFNKIDSAWKGKGEKNEGNTFGAAVADAKKDGDDSFKVGGKEYKVESNEEDLDEEAVVVSKRTPEGNIVSKLKEELTDAQKKLPPALQKAIAKKDGKDESVDESINEAEIRWGAVDNAIIKYIKYNVKVLEKPIKARDEDGTKKMLKAFIGGLVNAQRSLQLESINESEAEKIASLTGLRTPAVKKFIDDNNINDRKLLAYLKIKGPKTLSNRMDIATAIVGKPGNKYSQGIIKAFRK
jgi:hypothetical protein